MKRILTSALFLLPFLLMGQGFKMENETRYHNGAAPDIHSSTIHLTDTKVRMDSEDDEGSTSLIYDDEKKEMYVIQHDEESYMKITEEDIERMKAQFKKIEEQLENMPEEQREQMKEMMGERFGDMEEEETEYKKTGNDEEVENWGDCEEYEAYEGEKMVHKVYTTEMDNVELPKKNFEVLRSMVEFLSFSSLDMEELFPIEPGEEEEKPFEGFGVRWVYYDSNGRKTHESLVKEIGEEAIDPELFELPEGYEEQEMPRGPSDQGGR